MNTPLALAMILLATPPMLGPTAVEKLERSGVEVLGRDPAPGLCCALLPVHGPADVDSVAFPAAGFNNDHIRLLRHFPNLQSVRFPRSISVQQDWLVPQIVPKGTWLLYRVHDDAGKISKSESEATFRDFPERWEGPRSRPALGSLYDEDTNGDGIITEDDVVYHQNK